MVLGTNRRPQTKLKNCTRLYVRVSTTVSRHCENVIVVEYPRRQHNGTRSVDPSIHQNNDGCLTPEATNRAGVSPLLLLTRLLTDHSPAGRITP
jgi:hypothetical protein